MIVLTSIFIVGYLLIALEHPLKIEKAAVALVTGGLCWVLLPLSGTVHGVDSLLEHHLVDIASIVFFLLAAMTIVEVIESFDGFHLITRSLDFNDKRLLLIAIGFTTFFLSAVLDNLATTLVMLAVTAKRIPNGEDRLLFSGIIVVAANAGGAFSPIGDVTTTMLWIGGQLTFPSVVQSLFLPSLVAFLVPLLMVLSRLKGTVPLGAHRSSLAHPPGRNTIFVVGIGFLVSVPILKTLLHVPPYLSLLTGLGILWIITEILGRGKLRYVDERPNLPSALKKIDLPSILFFVGILLAVAALDSAGVLSILAKVLVDTLGSPELIASVLGLFSSVFDNVPLVAGAAKMFPLEQFATDAPFWHWLAFTAGTGGSLFVIGSAAGITAMGFAHIPFGWYARRIGLPAFAGYGAGMGVLALQSVVVRWANP